MSNLRVFQSFGFNVGAAITAMVIYPLIVATVKSLTKRCNDDRLERQMKLAYAEDSKKFDDMVTKAKTE